MGGSPLAVLLEWLSPALLCWVDHRRIQAEEALLHKSFGTPYRDDLRATW